MDKIINLLFRIFLIALGIGFFILLAFIFLIVFIFWGIKMLWWKITGHQPQNRPGFKFNPKSGFTYFYTKATSGESPYRADRRELDDVTDAEIKEITHLDDNSSNTKE